MVGPSSGAEWDWLKWLPHHQHPRWLDAARAVRMTYRSLGEAIAGCRPLDDNGSPHVVIVVDDGSAPVIEQPFTAGRRLKLRLDGDMRPDEFDTVSSFGVRPTVGPLPTRLECRSQTPVGDDRLA